MRTSRSPIRKHRIFDLQPTVRNSNQNYKNILMNVKPIRYNDQNLTQRNKPSLSPIKKSSIPCINYDKPYNKIHIEIQKKSEELKLFLLRTRLQENKKPFQQKNEKQININGQTKYVENTKTMNIKNLLENKELLKKYLKQIIKEQISQNNTNDCTSNTNQNIRLQEIGTNLKNEEEMIYYPQLKKLESNEKNSLQLIKEIRQQINNMFKCLNVK